MRKFLIRVLVFMPTASQTGRVVPELPAAVEQAPQRWVNGRARRASHPVEVRRVFPDQPEALMSELEREGVPTSSQIGVAVGLAQMHTKSNLREQCAWCFRIWPCPDRHWCDRILRLAREARRDV